MFKFNRKQNLIIVNLSLKQCYTCFSRDHDTSMCPDKAPELFVPKIDRNLLQRFYQLFNLWERYLLQFSISSFTTMLNLKPIRIIRDAELTQSSDDFKEKYKNDPIILTNSIRIQRRDAQHSPPLNEIVASRVKDIRLWYSTIESRELFFLFSSKTKIFKCVKTKVIPQITLSEILQCLPNVYDLQLTDTNIEVEDSWPDDLLKYKKEKNLEFISLDLKNFNFSYDKLVKLMRKNKNLKMRFTIKIQDNEKEALTILASRLKNYFFQTDSFSGRLDIAYYENENDGILLQNFKTFDLRNILSQQTRMFLNPIQRLH